MRAVAVTVIGYLIVVNEVEAITSAPVEIQMRDANARVDDVDSDPGPRGLVDVRVVEREVALVNAIQPPRRRKESACASR